VANLAQGSSENQKALVHARAIPQLASLLRSSESAETHRHAVHALVQETLWVLKKGHADVHFHTILPAHSVFALCDRQQILQAVFNS
jgi:hypothetical protein